MSLSSVPYIGLQGAVQEKFSDSLDPLSSLDLEAFLDFLLRFLYISRRLWAIKDLDNLFQ